MVCNSSSYFHYMTSSSSSSVPPKGEDSDSNSIIMNSIAMGHKIPSPSPTSTAIDHQESVLCDRRVAFHSLSPCELNDRYGENVSLERETISTAKRTSSPPLKCDDSEEVAAGYCGRKRTYTELHYHCHSSSFIKSCCKIDTGKFDENDSSGVNNTTYLRKRLHVQEEDPLQAEAQALWQKWSLLSEDKEKNALHVPAVCAYCNSYRHDAQGCVSLVQHISSLGRYLQELTDCDPRRVRGWFALYLRDIRDVNKLTSISEVLYRRACKQGLWQPVLQTHMTWPCQDEDTLRDFMVVCARFPTLWMSPSELLVAKKMLRQEAILQFSSPVVSSSQSTPRCSPLTYADT